MRLFIQINGAITLDLHRQSAGTFAEVDGLGGDDDLYRTGRTDHD